MSGQPTYAETTRFPGAITVSPPAAAAMDKESFPPSHATPKAIMASFNEMAASYMLAPSSFILAAYIQFTDALTSGSEVARAKTKLVKASPSANRAMAAGSIKPLMGCSPIAVARPVKSWWLCAMTATSATGMCKGPTHCCWAIRPVTWRSTLLVRKRLEQTEGRRRMRLRAETGVSPAGRVRGVKAFSRRLNSKVLSGIFPRTFSRSRSTGAGEFGAASLSTNVTRPLPSMVPITCIQQRSRSQKPCRMSLASGLINKQSFSWYSAPQISKTLNVSSPTLTARTSILAPRG
mmetsp:Transcript_4465/g.7985  ORF Transcript_4465/g.7985 Transcript_4465/m.7985 type:complete len:292 (+) Transcript_4465:1491-2366(+)